MSVVLLSGGMDSAALLYQEVDAHGTDDVIALTFNYGQRHAVERRYAAIQTQRARVQHLEGRLPLANIFAASSSCLVTSGPVPHGHYEDKAMRKTIVPNRNMIMLSIAGALAISRGHATVAFACHAGDYEIYCDCREDFVFAMREALRTCDRNPPELHTPFLYKTKKDIVKIGDGHGVDWAETWSCYEGGSKHCGRCGACNERKEAFAFAGTKDPTEYL